MSSRKATDTTSQSGVNYQAGSALASVPATKNVTITQNVQASRLTSGAGVFNGHAVEVWADGAVYDTVSGVFLFPGRDFNPGDLQRS